MRDLKISLVSLTLALVGVLFFVKATNAIYNIPPETTAVGALTATLGNEGVILQWGTMEELDVVGFNVYYTPPESPTYIVVNPTLILPINPGEPLGNVYTYTHVITNTQAPLCPGIYYWLVQTVYVDHMFENYSVVSLTLSVEDFPSSFWLLSCNIQNTQWVYLPLVLRICR